MVDIFDMKGYIVYILYTLLVSTLLMLRISVHDKTFIILNVVLYTVITSAIFYGHTKYEEKNIQEKYIRSILSLLYDTDRDGYTQTLKYFREKKEEPKKVEFIHKYSSLIVFITFSILFMSYYFLNRSQISTVSLMKHSYYLILLGLTELFVAFIVMANIPTPDIMNLMDLIVRKRETCSIENIKLMIPKTDNQPSLKCDELDFINGGKCLFGTTEFKCDKYNKITRNTS
jgi:hypothetical protein